MKTDAVFKLIEAGVNAYAGYAAKKKLSPEET
jgi:hypothetical protein